MSPKVPAVHDARFEADDARTGGGSASEASVRDQGPRAQCGERARVISLSATDNSSAGGRVTPPANNQSDLERAGQVATTSGIQFDSDLRFGSSPSATTSLSPEATPLGTAVVGRRVDALVIAYKVKVAPALRDEFQERQAIADLSGVAELLLDGLSFELKKSRKLYCVPFQNADVRCAFDERGPGGWNLEIVTRATFLATRALAVAIALSDRIATALGSVEGIRLRRVDLCADFVDFPICREDVERILSRSKTDVFISESKDSDEVSATYCKPSIREYRTRNLDVTGFTVAPGNPLMARIYDKVAELALAGREERVSLEHANWCSNGWDGASGVTRVEFQLRGEILDELRLRQLSSLESKLDSIWQTCVNWLRLVDPSSATRRNRCKLDARWQRVVGIQFSHAAHPLKRMRARGGATVQHAMGAVMSRLGSTRQLHRIGLVTDDGEILSSEREFADSLNQEQCLEFIREYTSSTCNQFSSDFADALVKRLGPREAAAHLVARNNAVRARFSSSDDTNITPRRLT